MDFAKHQVSYLVTTTRVKLYAIDVLCDYLEVSIRDLFEEEPVEKIASDFSVATHQLGRLNRQNPPTH